MSSGQDYTLVDKLVHKVGFSHPSVQLIATDVERILYQKYYVDISIDEPVFITSLPRAGTTLLLEAFHRSPNFATSQYRDMPFVAAPILWNAMTKGFKKNQVLKERAHGDGMMIGYDSPEAFEEVVWKLYWEEKYLVDRIQLWTQSDDEPEFQTKFTEFMRKVVYARRQRSENCDRYVSKNNSNIGRIAFLKQMFPQCKIVIPFRHPMDHAISMRKQHLNFLQRHNQDSFSKRYMGDIGHYEFGLLHRPMEFSGLHEMLAPHKPESLEYWVGYWIAAFRHVLNLQDSVVLMCYENACTDGRATMRTLHDHIGFDSSFIDEAGALFRSNKRYTRNDSVLNPKLLDEAQDIYKELMRFSIV